MGARGAFAFLLPRALARGAKKAGDGCAGSAWCSTPTDHVLKRVASRRRKPHAPTRATARESGRGAGAQCMTRRHTRGIARKADGPYASEQPRAQRSFPEMGARGAFAFLLPRALARGASNSSARYYGPRAKARKQAEGESPTRRQGPQHRRARGANAQCMTRRHTRVIAGKADGPYPGEQPRAQRSFLEMGARGAFAFLLPRALARGPKVSPKRA